MEIEPQIETDPCLASCCLRELRTNKIMRERGEYVRSFMPESLVNRVSIRSVKEVPAALAKSASNDDYEFAAQKISPDTNDEDRRPASDVDSDDIDA